MSWWLATIVTISGVVGGVLLFVLILDGIKHLMIRKGRMWHSIDYPNGTIPPFGLSLVAPLLTDKQGESHFGAYLVEYDRKARTAKALWITKPQ